jgi:hypothetical protein
MPNRAVTTSLLVVVVLVSKLVNHQAGERIEEMVQLGVVASGSLSECGGSSAREVMLPVKGASLAPVQKVISALKTLHSSGRVVLPEAVMAMLVGVGVWLAQSGGARVGWERGKGGGRTVELGPGRRRTRFG